MRQPEALRRTWSIGTPEQIHEQLAEYEEARIQELIVRFVDAAQLEPVRLFARESIQRR
jgi:alkanesulfonate monooxygenase SsuD/methylene tetrahydromethanopterin reductase-like flavin-dependent oxidoreductase (luciferase family)